jgi:hypothetical protein
MLTRLLAVRRTISRYPSCLISWMQSGPLGGRLTTLLRTFIGTYTAEPPARDAPWEPINTQ